MKTEIDIEVRNSPSGNVEYWAYIDVTHFSIWSLVHVLPLIDWAEPAMLEYVEGEPPMRIFPDLNLAVKKDNSWDETYPNLRVRSMNVTIVEGYLPGEDNMRIPEVDGFETTWVPSDGVLMVKAIPGYYFTENTEDDYDDGRVERVQVHHFVETAEATATLADFEAALRQVEFQTESLGLEDRVIELKATELLSIDDVSRIAWVTVKNTPDPPQVLPSPSVGLKIEKAPLSALDHDVEVVHPDNRRLFRGRVWLEPMATNDIIMYSRDAQMSRSSPITVTLDQASRSWIVDGAGTAAEYTKIFRVRISGVLIQPQSLLSPWFLHESPSGLVVLMLTLCATIRFFFCVIRVSCTRTMGRWCVSRVASTAPRGLRLRTRTA